MRLSLLGPLIVLMVLAGSFSLAPLLPERVATHFDASGRPDGFSDRWFGSLLIPGVMLVMLLVFFVLPLIDPKGNFASFRPAYDRFVVAMLLFMGYVQGIILAFNLGLVSDTLRLLAPALGALIVCVGFLLGAAKQNYFVGIRTPWTLASPRVWDRTHQRGALLFKVAGVLIGLLLFVGGELAIVAILALLIGVALYLVIYSFLVFREEKGKAKRKKK